MAVAPSGYTWWYLDALSDDGLHGLTIIAFIGSVFSPYYASARRRAPGAADPLRHCAINVALYGPSHHHWAMTERGERALQRSATRLRIGPSALAWQGGSLVLQLDEVTAPIPKRLRGTVRLTPQALPGCSFALDAQARHHWSPIAPLAQAEVDFERPGLRWSGPAYFDSNRGTRPLEADFVRWDWSRAKLPGGRAGVLYDVTRRGGEPLNLALHFDAAGTVQRFAAPPLQALPASGWRVQRGTRSDAGHTARVLRSLEDGPFYARSLVESQWLGERVHSVHESLSLDRFAARWVQAMLPFRMPRRGG